MNAPLRRPTEHSAQVRDEAARRALRQHDDAPLPAAAAAELQDWRLADAAHAQAMDDALHALRLLDQAAGADDIAAMRADALAARPDRHRNLRGPLAGVAALALIVAAIWSNGPHITESARLARPTAVDTAPANTYLTGVGERSTLSLPDGSVAILNTDSQLEVAYAADQRIVRLVRGQAIFEVAKDAARPFRVLAAGKRITAVGTEFDVRVDHDRLQVALLHGVVKVDAAAPEQTSEAATQMVAGDVLDVLDDHQVRVSRGDPARISSWREGQVVFDDESLANAVAEINRYSTRPIQIDPALAQRYFVSGVFKTGDTERFAQALVELFALKLAHDEAGRPLIGSPALTKDSQ